MDTDAWFKFIERGTDGTNNRTLYSIFYWVYLLMHCILLSPNTTLSSWKMTKIIVMIPYIINFPLRSRCRPTQEKMPQRGFIFFKFSSLLFTILFDINNAFYSWLFMPFIHINNEKKAKSRLFIDRLRNWDYKKAYSNINNEKNGLYRWKDEWMDKKKKGK